MSHMLRPKVEALIHRYGMVVPGDGVIVACSGGPDSLTLLGLLVALRKDYSLCLTAVYIDHGLRPQAAEEGEYVKHMARRWGVPALVRRVERDLHVTGESVQAQARQERYRLLDEVARQVGAARIATGHTADDQAETLVMRFARGTGCCGLAGILPVVGRVIRPLLLVRREETEDYCARQGIVPVHDPSNDEDVYLRNRVRHHLMPELSAFNPRFVEVLANLAESARAENEWMEQEAAKLLASAVHTDGGWWFPTLAFLDQPLALQRRALRALLRRLVSGRELGFDHVGAVLDMLVRGQTGASVSLPGGLVAWAEKEGFWVGPQRPVVEFDIVLAAPGRVRLPGSDLCLDAAVQAGGLDCIGEVEYRRTKTRRPWEPNGESVVFDRQRVQGRLRVRNWRAGDRFRPLGIPGEKKLQDMFVDDGIPKRWRDRLPVVVDDQGILWVAGAKLADRAKITSTTKVLVELRLCRNDA
jgi:tRNA(Ile)-lysidine synthase